MPTPTRPARSHRFALVGLAVVAAGFLAPRFLSAPDASSTMEPAPDYLGFLLKMVVGTLLFAGACFLAIRRTKPAAPALPPAMEILATVPIASRGVVHLVRAGKRRLLLGVDLHGVKAIAELPGPAPEPIVGPLRLAPEAA
jgi:flagellar protein FliO/FliZ